MEVKTISKEELKQLYDLDNFINLSGGKTVDNGQLRSLRNARIEIEALFERYPSLPEEFEIPKNCPYTYYDVINRDLKREG
ncbi:MAG: hypothetical protein WHT47_01420 [Hydrogenothermaceae bacterium]